jgi:hypothetical protein
LEHLKHGGVDNGRLPVTYSDFGKEGVRRNSVYEALLVAIHLGWIERTGIGSVPWQGDIREPSHYRLTWLPNHDGAPPTNRWARIKTVDDAKAAVKHAKAQLAQVRKLSPSLKRGQKQTPNNESDTWPSNESDTWASNESVLEGNGIPIIPSNDSDTPFYISGYQAGAGVTGTALAIACAQGAGRYAVSSQPLALQPYYGTRALHLETGSLEKNGRADFLEPAAPLTGGLTAGSTVH